MVLKRPSLVSLKYLENAKQKNVQHGNNFYSEDFLIILTDIHNIKH